MTDRPRTGYLPGMTVGTGGNELPPPNLSLMGTVTKGAAVRPPAPTYAALRTTSPDTVQVCWGCDHAKADHIFATGECMVGWSVDETARACQCLRFEEVRPAVPREGAPESVR